MTDAQKKQLTSPSFWMTIITALGAVGSGLTAIGNPVTIAIGAAVTAIYTIAQKFENVATINAQQTPPSDSGALEKAAALVPIVEQQVGHVATLIKTVNDHIAIAEFKLKGYEVSPHVNSPTQTTTLSPPQPTQLITSAPPPAIPGGAHEVIGKGT